MNKNELRIILIFDLKRAKEILPKLVVGETVKAFGKDSKGLWGQSDKELTFKIKDAAVGYIDLEDGFASLDVYPEGYDADDNGLIYTDEKFEKHIKDLIPGIGIDYSEQGMQGDDYVNFDVSLK